MKRHPAHRRPIGDAEFRALSAGVAGLPLSASWRGQGSTLFLELGALTFDPEERHPKGEWTVMISWSWRVEGPRSIHFGSWSTDPRITGGIARLAGDRVLGAAIEGRLPELAISLASGRTVRSFMTESGQPAWALFRPDGSWIEVKGGRLVHDTQNAGVDNGVSSTRSGRIGR